MNNEAFAPSSVNLPSGTLKTRLAVAVTLILLLLCIYREEKKSEGKDILFSLLGNKFSSFVASSFVPSRQ